MYIPQVHIQILAEYQNVNGHVESEALCRVLFCAFILKHWISVTFLIHLYSILEPWSI